ncbi:serine hydroxymethyltransferase [Helicobacter sp. MIT 14-3879]|uniref:serine hydroxymethyltransferase n=1 Tax=Helicobacter sp. MIT 14-3879 TaxID=2040649 RepID=UPI000E1E9B08|nr:serine hydroxymethyltransferase [Helicobacter sp. MIT 14-3879]RDU62286.1 serine hydroxymethyltransferase [Helicobacter sp. MIT 14-3879]
MNYLEQNDKTIFDLIQKEWHRQRDCLEMIASENFTFPSVIEALGSVLTNKYAEGYPNKRYYGGCEFVDEIEQIAIDRAKKLFKCDFANVQPHSGSQANAAVYASLLKPYDKILGMHLNHGGHLTHGAKVSQSGKTYQSFFYGVELDGRINYDKLEEYANVIKPNIIICGFSAYTRELDFKRFREIADRVGAILFGDIAHIAGLVVGDEYPNPFPHCHVVSTTTHKTLRGPRGGVILTNDEDIINKVNKAVFPGTQGGPLVNVIAAKAVGFAENLKPEWKIYAKQVKNNAKILGEVFIKRGYNIVSGGTDNHLILMSLIDKPFSGKDADFALERAGITVNKNMVPGDTRSPFITSGIRIGSPALTSRGMKEKEFEYIANKICDILDDISNTSLQDKIKVEIKEFNKNFQIYEKAIY